MPKGAKKRAKLKKKQQGGHPAGSDGGAHANNNKEGSNNSSHGDAASDGNHLPIPLNIPHVDASEDSMESSEEMVTPRAGADEEEKKGAASEVPVEVVEADVTAEEVMVDALPPEAAEREQEGKGDLGAEAHAVVQEPEPEAKSEEAVVQETAKVHPAHEPETTAEEVVVRETATASVVQKPEAKGEVSRSREADGAQTTEVVRGPAVAVAAAQHRAKWWDCCGVFDAVAGSER
ncbi:serine-aspartate repeat-containing protein I-like [Lolium rigidum]|uniref:serine-aspartate repeat-containing protein I-like n=1 Tax=Lolium rigidum TaxID=89674 RepID=UPI001F5D0ABD|nr:serine-aspartate repeat-containing protein I-like [Lolium rigidum]